MNKKHLQRILLPSHYGEGLGVGLLLLFFLVPFCVRADDWTAYIKHSSGLIVGDNGAGRVVILDKNDAKALPMRFVETSDGWLNIELTQANGEVRYLTKTGSWNANFEKSPNKDEAKFKIEGNMAGLVKIICKANNLYLGTDENEAGKNVYSNKDGGDVKHQWFITADKNAEPDVSTARFVLDAKNLKQENEGWGVSLCWWANMCGKWNDKKIDQLVDWLVSPTGLNYNIFRYNIGGGDDPQNRNCTKHHMGSGKGLRAEMEGFKDSSDDEYHWDRDEAQRKIMLKIKEKRPDAIFEAFSNTPPYYMTYSGCCSGNVEGGKDNLKPEYYEEFANYLVDVCKHYKDEYGIEFKTLEPFNEATTDYWHCSGVQEGCHFDYASQIKFIKVLYPILKKSGLNTIISAADETAVWPAICGFNEYKNAGIMNMVGQWNTHTYWGNNNDRKNFNALVRGVGKKLWMSETGSGGNGLQGNLNMAQRLIDDVRYIAPDAWVDWQYMEEANDQWCLVRGSFADQTVNKVKNYYVRQQFSRFIKQGYTYVGTENEQTLAAISPERDTLVVVTLNNTAQKKDHVVQVKNFAPDAEGILSYLTDGSHNLRSVSTAKIADGQLTYTMPSYSVQTIILPLAKPDAIRATTADELMQCSSSRGKLHVSLSSPCAFAVYNTGGMIVGRGNATADIALPSGIYIVRAEKGKKNQAITIRVKK